MSENIKQFLEADAPLPCPFCGSKPKQRQNKTQHCQLHGEPSASVSIYCDNPRCSSRPSATDGDVYNGGYQAAKAEAIAAWNTRTPDRNLLAAFKQVCVALERAKSMHSRAAALYRLSSCGNAAYNEDLNYSINLSFDALAAAAPYRKLGGV